MRTLISIALALAIYSCTPPNGSRIIVEGSDIDVGKSIAGNLGKNETDTFKVNLQEGTFVSGYADQITADVIIHILDPEGKETNDYDDSARGHDPFFFTTKATGIYSIVIEPFRESEGSYELMVTKAIAMAESPEGRIDQIATTMIAPNDPGASVAVAKDGKIIYSHGFGMANLEYGIKNTPQTIFHIASVSKQFTGFAIAMLADQGKLSMSDDIRKYIPELHDFGTPITLNHLVHHTSGLRDQWNLLAMAGWRLDDVITREQILRMMYKQHDLNFPPGDEMVYCNTGFTLLAEVVSRVTGKSFAAWTKENIFEPLEMNHTLFYDDHEKIVPNRAYSYHRQDTIMKKSVLSYANVGATSLFTTVEDLSKWAMNFEKVTVGNPHIMEMMEERFVLNRGDTMSYGYGQALGTYKGLKTVSHGGADAGYRTFLLRFPEQHMAITVFSNLGSFSPGGLAYTIADAYLADQFREETKKEETPPPPPPAEEPFDPSTMNLADYTGRFYSDELETFYTFEVVNDTLVAHHQRHDDFKLKPVHPDGFEANVWWMGDMHFLRDGGHKVNGLSVSNGRVENLKFRKVSVF